MPRKRHHLEMIRLRSNVVGITFDRSNCTSNEECIRIQGRIEDMQGDNRFRLLKVCNPNKRYYFASVTVSDTPDGRTVLKKFGPYAFPRHHAMLVHSGEGKVTQEFWPKDQSKFEGLMKKRMQLVEESGRRIEQPEEH